MNSCSTAEYGVRSGSLHGILRILRLLVWLLIEFVCDISVLVEIVSLFLVQCTAASTRIRRA